MRDSPEVSFLHAARRAALDILLEPFLGKETSLYQWRSTTFLQKNSYWPAREVAASAYKNYDELLAAAADAAVTRLAEQSSSARVERLGMEAFLTRWTCFIPSGTKAC